MENKLCINIWGEGTHSTKMGADSSTKHTPNAPKSIYTILLPQAETFSISIKKGFTGQGV